MSDDDSKRRMEEVFNRHIGRGKYTLPGYGTENHPSRRVDRDSIAKRIPNYDPHEEQEPPWEPDYEDITRRRQERRRPDWDT